MVTIKRAVQAAETNTMDRIQLPYTLQTWAGMVQVYGLPSFPWKEEETVESPVLTEQKTVTLPHVPNPGYSRFQLAERLRSLVLSYDWYISSFQEYVETDWFDSKHAAIPETVIACLRQGRMPDSSRLSGSAADKARYKSNILACQNDKADIHLLMTLMKNRTRLSLQQAAATVVSAFVKHGRLADAEVLIRELTGVLAVSSMSGGSSDATIARYTLAKSRAEAFAHTAHKAYEWCSKAMEKRGNAPLEGGVPRNCTDLVRLLLRVRCTRPSTKERCLYIPRWMFEEAGIEPEEGHAVHLNEYQAELEEKERLMQILIGYRFPVNPARDDSIVLAKHAFRVLQRRLFRTYRFWDHEVTLHHAVRGLEDKVLYASAWVDAQLRQTDDVAKVACWFFAYQRRLQLKVVSDEEWTRFLAKGEGKLLYQNTLSLKSTFEVALARIAGLDPDSLTKSGGGDDDTLKLIDQTCLLMKRYVDVYGQGKKENLVFKRDVKGGSGRGAVDEYNMLCVIMRDLKLRAKDEGIEDLPGPVYKFLAKDILHWNKSWDDDAFANGRVHGWEEWVVKRGLV